MANPITMTRRRMAALGGELILSAPTLIRGDRATRAATAGLRRLVRRRTPRLYTARSRLLLSDNPHAVLALARATPGPGSTLTAIELADPVRIQALRLTREPQLLRESLRLLRLAGRVADARPVVDRLFAGPLPDELIRDVVLETARLGDLELLQHVAGLLAGQPDVKAGLRADCQVLQGLVAPLLRAENIDALVASRELTPFVEAALGEVISAANLPRAALRAMGELLHGRGTLPPAIRARLAKELHLRGDITLTARLSSELATQGWADPKIAAIARTAEANARTLLQGWDAPPARERDYLPTSGRVQYLLHNSLPHNSGGYATRTHGLLAGANRRGWDVHGVTRPGYPYGAKSFDKDVPAEDVVDGVHYHRLLKGRQKFPFWPLEAMVDSYTALLEPLIHAQAPGIIHGASNFRNGMAAVVAARRHGLPSVYEVRGLWELTRQVREPEYVTSEHHALTAMLETEVALAADHVLVITRALGALLEERGVPAEKITLLPNGVDTTRFRPLGWRDEQLAQRLGIVGKTVIGYVGSTVDYEGLGLLIEAAARLKRDRSDFAVVIVGDGAALEGWQLQARRAGVLDVLQFTGRVPHEEVESYYSIMDIFPLPRLPEKVCEVVSPLKPFEVMAAGKTLVVSSVAALEEIVQDGITGLVFAKGSAEALTEALRTALDQPDLRTRLGARAHEWVRRERDWSRLSATLDDVYRELWARYHPDVMPPTAG